RRAGTTGSAVAGGRYKSPRPAVSGSPWRWWCGRRRGASPSVDSMWPTFQERGEPLRVVGAVHRVAANAFDLGVGLPLARQNTLDDLVHTADRRLRAGAQGPDELRRGLLQPARLDDLVDQSQLPRLLGVDKLRRQQQVACVRGTDERDQLPGGKKVVDDAELGRGDAEPRVRRREPEITGHRQLATAADAVAVDHRHAGLAQGAQR